MASVSVPVIPTYAMLAAGSAERSPAAIWAAMIAARPIDAAHGVLDQVREIRGRLAPDGCDIPPETLDVLPAAGSYRRNPEFWGDLEVRRMVVDLHRQVKISTALRIIEEQVGPERAPSKSALARAWKRIDILKKSPRGGRVAHAISAHHQENEDQ